MAPRKTKTVTLTSALSQLLAKTLLPDLRERAAEPAVAQALRAEHAKEAAAGRTADSLRDFTERTLEQVGAAWVLSCVFVRTLEDRGLLAQRRLAGEGALDSEQLFFELAPSLTARDYLQTVFTEVGSLPGAEDVLGRRHNPAFRLSPSNDGARALLDFFRERDEAGALRWTFAGEDTRFLGDLYQDLSEHVRKRYALLQTPAFVESFILDQTLTPALAEYGYAEVRVIDPTCGSGHFVLGAFERLLDERLRNAPGIDVRTHALDALEHVYGVDVNPYAVAIARFRLTLAYLARAGFKLLAQAPRLQLNLAVADSLLHGAQNAQTRLTEQEGAREEEAAFGFELFALDDAEEAARVLGQRYHAVVGNPPYITCKDAKLRDAYRQVYKSCYREYALSAPFTERFFQLAVDSGFVGMINANSFMKREFGSALIEQVLPFLDLARVIDTAGAYVPGHGTPTVLLFGRNRKPASEHVRAVLGKRGEPSTPADPEQGLVWRSIADHFDQIGFENDYVSVATVPRSTLEHHPWSLGGGGASDLKALLEGRAERTLGDIVELIGFGAVTREDDLFALPKGTCARLGVSPECVAVYGYGEAVRDWGFSADIEIVFPYDKDGTVSLDKLGRWGQLAWRVRTQLWNRQGKGFKTKKDSGGEFYEYSMFYPERHFAPLKIAFAFVATHNHFVLDRGGKVFNRSAPIIKLPESATEDDHLALLAYLNSSTACFYFRQILHSKGGQGVNEGHKAEEWEQFLEFSGTAISALPLPHGWQSLAKYGRQLSALADERAALDPMSSDSAQKDAEILSRMVALQEELDYRVYALFELIESVPEFIPLEPGFRPFEITLARSERRTAWFSRHGYEVPTSAPHSSVRDSVQLLEQPVFKRRWQRRDWAAERARHIESTFLSEAEKLVAGQAAALTVRSLPFVASDHGCDDPTRLVQENSVPFLSHYRFAASGLAKHFEWKRTWSLQLNEDRGETAEIPVPPRYGSTDYSAPHYWQLRGKLDVPKERFISYPGCQKDGDPSPLIGWAGWNHLQRAQALIALYQERKLEDGWDTKRLMPMLVGLHELMFWLELWHSAPEAGSANPAREVQQYLSAELNTSRLTTADLEAWRPEAKKAGKRASRAKPARNADSEDAS